jgi:hypothetical protein
MLIRLFIYEKKDLPGAKSVGVISKPSMVFRVKNE